ncbi:MAG: RhuM family protein [Bacteroidales bacterium]
MKNEIIIYQPDELTKVEVIIEDETVWLTLNQIAQLFGRDKSVISRHLRNIYKVGELVLEATVAKNATVQIEAGREVKREIDYYNLDAILSVGYRVNSKQGTQFRIWANKVLKDYLLKGYSLNTRMNRIEDNVEVLTKKVNEIDVQIHAALPPKQGIFYDGQVFDAYVFVADLIKSAKKSIILIDNYVDETVLQLFTKRNKNVTVKIYTKTISKTLKQDLEKHNAQYPKIEIEKFDKAHDRFLMIDETTVYHIGASLKDLGKKWFAFSKMEMDAMQMIANLGKGGGNE